MTTNTKQCSGACIVHCGDGDVDDGGDGTGGGGCCGGCGGHADDGEDTYLLQKKDYQSQSEVPAPNASQEILGLLKLDPDVYTRDDDRLYTRNDRSCLPYIPARYVLALMSFTGFISIFTLRMDLNIAILSIAQADNDTNTQKNMTIIKPSHTWSEEKQNMALSAFYYGYCCTQIIGGYLSGIIGATRIMGYSVLVTSLVALATPPAIMGGYYLLVLCRVLQGLAQGLAQPCMHTIWSNWAPRNEKSKLLTFSFSGCQLGNIVATVATGYMCQATPVLKWSLVFYVFGGVGFLWSITWLLLVHETPRRHPRISRQELEYIEETTAQVHDKLKVKPPWRQMVLNPAFLAIVSAQFANDWGYFALSTCLPLYMQHVLQYDIKQNGFLSSLPFIVLLFTNPLAGYLADLFIARGILSTKNCRKAMNSVGLLIPAVLMVGVCFVGMDRHLTIALLTLALGFTGFTIAGYTVNHLDIVPPFAGLLYSISNTIGTTTGFLGPAIITVLTHKHDTRAQWRVFFSLTAAIFFVGGMVFLFLAQGEPLRWVQPYLRKVMAPVSEGHLNDDDVNNIKRHEDDEDDDDDDSDDNDDDGGDDGDDNGTNNYKDNNIGPSTTDKGSAKSTLYGSTNEKVKVSTRQKIVSSSSSSNGGKNFKRKTIQGEEGEREGLLDKCCSVN